MTSTKDKKNIHGGHRERLLNLVMSAGLDALNEVQVLEFLLSVIIPRIDTNPLAHKLLEEFGNVSSVLDANPTALMNVEGIGKRTANLLSLLPPIFSYYKKDKIPKNITLTKHEHCVNFFKMLLEDKDIEEFYIVALNAKFKVINYKLLSRGNMKNVGFTTHEVSNFISSTKAMFVILGHNHPGGTADPSSMDKENTKIISELAGLLGAKLIDHFIFGQDGVYSMNHDALIWSFDSSYTDSLL